MPGHSRKKGRIVARRKSEGPQLAWMTNEYKMDGERGLCNRSYRGKHLIPLLSSRLIQPRLSFTLLGSFLSRSVIGEGSCSENGNEPVLDLFWLAWTGHLIEAESADINK